MESSVIILEGRFLELCLIGNADLKIFLFLWGFSSLALGPERLLAPLSSMR